MDSDTKIYIYAALAGVIGTFIVNSFIKKEE